MGRMAEFRFLRACVVPQLARSFQPGDHYSGQVPAELLELLLRRKFVEKVAPAPALSAPVVDPQPKPEEPDATASENPAPRRPGRPANVSKRK